MKATIHLTEDDIKEAIAFLMNRSGAVSSTDIEPTQVTLTARTVTVGRMEDSTRVDISASVSIVEF